MLHIPVSFVMTCCQNLHLKLTLMYNLCRKHLKHAQKGAFLLNGLEIATLHGKNTAILIMIKSFSYCHFFHSWSKFSCYVHLLNSNNYTTGKTKSKINKRQPKIELVINFGCFCPSTQMVSRTWLKKLQMAFLFLQKISHSKLDDLCSVWA